MENILTIAISGFIGGIVGSFIQYKRMNHRMRMLQGFCDDLLEEVSEYRSQERR
jgi:hypothetical protein